MAKQKQSVKIFIDPYGNTVNFWWGNPADSAYSEEAKDSWDVIVMDKNTVRLVLKKSVSSQRSSIP